MDPSALTNAVVGLVDSLGARLPVQQVVDAYLLQAQVVATWNTVAAWVLGVVASLCLGTGIYISVADHDECWVGLGMIAFVILGALAGAFGWEAYVASHNPVYWALQQVLG